MVFKIRTHSPLVGAAIFNFDNEELILDTEFEIRSLERDTIGRNSGRAVATSVSLSLSSKLVKLSTT